MKLYCSENCFQTGLGFYFYLWCIFIYICFTTTLNIDGCVFLLCFNKGQIVSLGFCLKSLSMSITIKVQSNSLSGNVMRVCVHVHA